MSDAPPAREHVAIVRSGERQAGIAVDGLLGQDQAVIKPLGTLFRNVPAVIVVGGRTAEPIEGDGLLPLHLFNRVTFDAPRRRLVVE